MQKVHWFGVPVQLFATKDTCDDASRVTREIDGLTTHPQGSTVPCLMDTPVAISPRGDDNDNDDNLSTDSRPQCLRPETSVTGKCLQAVFRARGSCPPLSPLQLELRARAELAGSTWRRASTCHEFTTEHSGYRQTFGEGRYQTRSLTPIRHLPGRTASSHFPICQCWTTRRSRLAAFLQERSFGRLSVPVVVITGSSSPSSCRDGCARQANAGAPAEHLEQPEQRHNPER